MKDAATLYDPSQLADLPEPLRTEVEQTMALSTQIVELLNGADLPNATKLNALLNAYTNAAMSLASREFAIVGLSMMAANMARMLEKELAAATAVTH